MNEIVYIEIKFRSYYLYAFLIVDMPRVSYYKGLAMHLLKYTTMLADVDGLEMTVVNFIWHVMKSKFHLQKNEIIVFYSKNLYLISF